MPQDKSAREIIDIVWSKGVAYGIKSSPDLTSEVVTQSALQSLSSLIEGEMPKEKELLIRPGKPKNSRFNKNIMGYNLALSDCLSSIKKVLG
jgi:hypothetical protein